VTRSSAAPPKTGGRPDGAGIGGTGRGGDIAGSIMSFEMLDTGAHVDSADRPSPSNFSHAFDQRLSRALELTRLWRSNQELRARRLVTRRRQIGRSGELGRVMTSERRGLGSNA